MSTENDHRAETPESPLSGAAPASLSPPESSAPDNPGALTTPAEDKAGKAAPAGRGEGSAPPPPEMAAGQDENPAPAQAAVRAEPLRMPDARPDRDGQKPGPGGGCSAGLPKPGPASRLFGGLSVVGLPVLIALTALMTASQLLVTRSLWFSDEVRHADVYMRLLEGHWLILNLNGQPYPDKPPLYFWLLQLLDRIPGVDQPLLFFLATALSAVLFIAVTWLLARATGHDRRVSFAAGLVALGCLFVAGAAHYPRMDLLFAVVITLSLLCLYRGWIKKSAPVWLTLGFVLAAAATLIKGPLGLAFPLLTSLLFLFWRGTPGRLNGRDGLLGFALMLIILLTWTGALFIQGESEYLREIFGRQIAGRMVSAWHHAGPWWYYLAALPLVWLPWIFLILFIDWWKAARHLPEAWKTRREDGGRGWLWLTVIGGTALLSALSGKIVIYLLPLLPALAVLTARALLRLSPRRSSWFFGFLGLFFGLTGLIFVAGQFSSSLLPWLPESWITQIPALARAYLDNSAGLALMGAVFLLLAVVLLFLTRRCLPDGALLLTSLGIVLLMQPYSLVVAPSLETMLSPRAQAEAMSDYVRQGYAPAAYRVYPGIYAYYVAESLAAGDPDAPRSGVTVPDLDNSAALTAFLAAHPRAVVAMSEKNWMRWEDKPSDIFEAQRQWMVDQPYVLAVRDATGEAGPSDGERELNDGALPPGPDESSGAADEERAPEDAESSAAPGTTPPTDAGGATPESPEDGIPPADNGETGAPAATGDGGPVPAGPEDRALSPADAPDAGTENPITPGTPPAAPAPEAPADSAAPGTTGSGGTMAL
ncbi:MAG: glycosyltransferase family 39 protein [Desulfovibrionaceae bacterium]|nr:glycosyltransferase family 39 protein [Desulfovibrionaceae bacterium]